MFLCVSKGQFFEAALLDVGINPMLQGKCCVHFSAVVLNASAHGWFCQCLATEKSVVGGKNAFFFFLLKLPLLILVFLS